MNLCFKTFISIYPDISYLKVLLIGFEHFFKLFSPIATHTFHRLLRWCSGWWSATITASATSAKCTADNNDVDVGCNDGQEEEGTHEENENKEEWSTYDNWQDRIYWVCEKQLVWQVCPPEEREQHQIQQGSELPGDEADGNEIPNKLNGWVLGVTAIHWMALGFLKRGDEGTGKLFASFVCLSVRLVDVLYEVGGALLARGLWGGDRCIEAVFVEVAFVETEFLGLFVELAHVVLEVFEVDIHHQALNTLHELHAQLFCLLHIKLRALVVVDVADNCVGECCGRRVVLDTLFKVHFWIIFYN